MNSKHLMMAMACAAALCGGVRAESNGTAGAEAPAGWNWAMGEGVMFGETKIVSAEVALAFDSKYLSYGLVDNNDPILTPGASLTFFDWVEFGVEAIYDVTRYGGKRAGGERLYENRQFQYQELDPGVSLCHAFGPDDAAWLPTTVELSLGYVYEYHPRSYATGHDDTQFVNLEMSLPDLWIEPTLAYERDTVRDNGTYVNLELGHGFEICDGLAFRPSVAQGLGNTQRVAGYLAKADGEALDHGGLMDTCIKGELAWTPVPGLTFTAYAAYSDYLFDSTMRGAARRYEASGDWTESWNFVGGLAVTVSF